MGELTSFIMLLDVKQTIPIGLISLTGAGLITYYLIKSKRKKQVLTSENGSIKFISKDLTDVPTEDFKKFDAESKEINKKTSSITENFEEESKSCFNHESTINEKESLMNTENQNTNLESEDILKKLAEDSQKIDQKRKKQSIVDNSNFEEAFDFLDINQKKSASIQNSTEPNLDKGLLEQFGALATTIALEKKQEKEEYISEKDCFEIWVNYIAIKEDKMLLNNTFVHLSSPWGTVSSINELNEHISKELDLDITKKNWTIVSITKINN